MIKIRTDPNFFNTNKKNQQNIMGSTGSPMVDQHKHKSKPNFLSKK